MAQDSDPQRPPLPGPLRFLERVLPAYCRDEITGDLNNEYQQVQVPTFGKPEAIIWLHREVVEMLPHLPALWLHQHWLSYGPLHWHAIRVGRCVAKRSGAWYLVSKSMQRVGRPVDTVRLIVYDPQRDLFLATKTYEVAAGWSPPQTALAIGNSSTAMDREQFKISQELANMTGRSQEYWMEQHYQQIGKIYTESPGGFRTRIVAAPLPSTVRGLPLRPTTKGRACWLKPDELCKAVSYDPVYCGAIMAYRAQYRLNAPPI
jgi:hypothetical protein